MELRVAFTRMDTNGDGQVDLAELKSAGVCVRARVRVRVCCRVQTHL